ELRDTTPSFRTTLLILVVIFILTLVCDRTKANAKLIPAIIVVHIAITNASRLKIYIPLVALMGLALVPVPELIRNPIPPFLSDPNQELPAHAWQEASSSKFMMLFAGDFRPLSLRYSGYHPISVLAIIGFPLVYSGIAGLLIGVSKALRAIRSAAAPMTATRQWLDSRQGKIVSFLAIWSVINVLALASYPKLPTHFQSRYAISVLIPSVPLLLLLTTKAWTACLPSRKRLGRAFIIGLVGIHILSHSLYTLHNRSAYFCDFMIASNKLCDHVDRQLQNSLVICHYFGVPSYRPTARGNRWVSVSGPLNLKDVAAEYEVSLDQCFVVARPQFRYPETVLTQLETFDGSSDALFDRLFPRQHEVIKLYSVSEGPREVQRPIE
ncbi:MAG: hypothetical protein AAF745_18895, partial [Planctomycetota bacterium]